MRPTEVRRRVDAIAFRLNNTAASLRGWLYQNRVCAYWYIGTPNFGDRLTPLLLDHYGLTPVHVRADKSSVVAVGSVLGWLPRNYAGVILGAGLLEDVRHPLVQAKVLGVRGELTRNRIGASPDAILGDPGLLVSRLFAHGRKKAFQVGLIPHYVDRQDSAIARITERLGDTVTVIDVTRHPLQVLAEIDRCESVLSSSLHGVIAADALNIPNAWISLSAQVIGASFKFRDYASALGKDLPARHIDGRESIDELIALTSAAPESVASVQDNLHQAFLRLRSLLESHADVR